MYRAYADDGVSFQEEVLADIGCGTGIGWIAAWFCGIRKIRATDIQGGMLKVLVDWYAEVHPTGYFGGLTELLPSPNLFAKIMVQEEVNIFTSR